MYKKYNTRAPEKARFFIPKMPISRLNPMFDLLLESSHRDDSNKRSNIGFGQEIMELASIEVYFTHVIWNSDTTSTPISPLEISSFCTISNKANLSSPITSYTFLYYDILFYIRIKLVIFFEKENMSFDKFWKTFWKMECLLLKSKIILKFTCFQLSHFSDRATDNVKNC